MPVDWMNMSFGTAFTTTTEGARAPITRPSRRRVCAALAGTACFALERRFSWALPGQTAPPNRVTDRALAAQILGDARLGAVRQLGRQLLGSGLRAGTTYPEVWIRDTNTFIEAALPVTGPAPMREALRSFLQFQGSEGDIPDGYLPTTAHRTAAYRTSPHLPETSAFKNTVESDQESSLVSATRKYIDVTHDTAFLDEDIDGRTVRQRLGLALRYLLLRRWDSTRGLVWAGATIDWGDIEPEDKLGDQIDERSHPACSIYANAMFAVAMRDYLHLPGISSDDRAFFLQTRKDLSRSVRRHLWDARAGKYRTHLYLKGSPFPAGFDEDAILYLGGTAIAVEAGFLRADEIRLSLARMRRAVKDAHAASIGLTVYPPYPRGYFLNPSVAEPYHYQNGGDWCWFGGRMVQQLVAQGMVADAWQEFEPMIDRVVKHQGFYEWWSPSNEPHGSGSFRGSAGVLLKAADMFTAWAGTHA